MKTSRLILAGALFVGTTAAFAAAHTGKMSSMDSNGDGMVSKQEYISHHEAMFDKMDKGGKGMVPMKDMQSSMRSQDPATPAARAEKQKLNEQARKGQGPNTSPATQTP
jgi:Spy/CpxP family protein refolding chaperone